MDSIFKRYELIKFPDKKFLIRKFTKRIKMINDTLYEELELKNILNHNIIINTNKNNYLIKNIYYQENHSPVRINKNYIDIIIHEYIIDSIKFNCYNFNNRIICDIYSNSEQNTLDIKKYKFILSPINNIFKKYERIISKKIIVGIYGNLKNNEDEFFSIIDLLKNKYNKILYKINENGDIELDSCRLACIDLLLVYDPNNLNKYKYICNKYIKNKRMKIVQLDDEFIENIKGEYNG